jgi:OOP family OmpA-OmpF porin
MQPNILKITLATALLAVLSGCSNHPVRISNPNSAFCTLAGAGLGGGGAALASAGGPVVAGGVMLGAAIGNYICSSDGRPVAQPVAAVTPAPAAPVQRPAEVVRDLDGDNDGVIDRLDRCPNTPAGAKVNANGCPEVLMTLTGVNFQYDSSQIDPSSESVLNQAVTALNDARTINVRIVGHTDSRGSEEYNQALSERRAIAVRNYLTGKGISASRLTTVGEGEGRPISSNTTDDGRYQNRRVELHVNESR